jgi:hypothetical protein
MAPPGGRIVSNEVSRNEWGVIRDGGGVLELCWLPSTASMTDGAFMATLCLLALEAERTRPRGILVDATDFRHQFTPGLMAWRDAHVVPRYGAAGVRRFAFVMPPSFAQSGMERMEEPAIFPTRWFIDRGEAIRWASPP